MLELVVFLKLLSRMKPVLPVQIHFKISLHIKYIKNKFNRGGMYNNYINFVTMIRISRQISIFTEMDK